MENKELIVWIEVPRSNEEHSFKPDYTVFERADGEIVWLKRVVIPILSDQETKNLGDEIFPSFFDHYSWEHGYKAKQNELLNKTKCR